MRDDGYDDYDMQHLYNVIDDVFPHSVELSRSVIGAIEQHAYGKGRERHGIGEFADQPINRIPDMLGSVGQGFLLGQAIKKIQESSRMGDEEAIRELEGAIVYLGTAIHRIRRV